MLGVLALWTMLEYGGCHRLKFESQWRRCRMYTDRLFGSLPPPNAGHVPNIYRQATSHFVFVSHRAPLHLAPTTKRNSMHAYISRYAGR